MSLIKSVQPTEEPITTAEAKIHLRVDQDDEDTLIASLIKTARIETETFTKRTLVDTTYVYKIDLFPGGYHYDSRILLPTAPLDSVTSVTYLDTNNASQTLSTDVYEVDTSSLPPRIRLKYDQSWPSTLSHPEVITITFVAGYGSASDVPENIKAAVKLLVAHYFEIRDVVVVGTITAKIPLSVERLLADATLPMFA